MSKQKTFVQYGAGYEAIKGWISFDASPTLRIQKLPIIGKLLRSKLNCIFDDEIYYGDIIKGLPLQPESVDGLFCSHVLEHLSYAACSIALKTRKFTSKMGGDFELSSPI